MANIPLASYLLTSGSASPVTALTPGRGRLGLRAGGLAQLLMAGSEGPTGHPPQGPNAPE